MVISRPVIKAADPLGAVLEIVSTLKLQNCNKKQLFNKYRFKKRAR
ncbi:MAG: hypothetical protein QXO70_02620 [Candidatus Pacearchaeota archaeon]